MPKGQYPRGKYGTRTRELITSWCPGCRSKNQTYKPSQSNGRMNIVCFKCGCNYNSTIEHLKKSK